MSTRSLRLGQVVLTVALGAAVGTSVIAAPGGAAKPAAPAKPAAAAKAAPVNVPAEAARLVGADASAAADAAKALGRSGDPAAHDALLDALATGVAPEVAAAALGALAAHPAPPDAAMLVLYAGHRNDQVRAAAVGALGAYPDPQARKAAVAALGDDEQAVRDAAANAVATGKIREGVDRLMALLDRGDSAAPPALAALADADMAHAIGEHLGTAPAPVLALTLGKILRRADFPEPARVQVVRTLAKVPGAEATTALTDYVEATPEKPPRQSRKEAEAVVEARISGGGQ
ncbi:MAG: HEAT repeat domain-containing protein [Deltaproteobacteria bacterium]|nr:HEAT repeat domain-containing protein [Deltaproteobacteria bacterium]